MESSDALHFLEVKMIIVDIALALICFSGECHNALIGRNTPKGEYQLVHKITDDPGYGGDVLVFHETEKTEYAIHRVWLLKPEQNRMKRLASDNPKNRVITSGCINVDNEVYEALVECCKDEKIVVK
jgi:hypothetical protein